MSGSRRLGLGGGIDQHLLVGGVAAQQVAVVGHLGVDGDLGDRQVGQLADVRVAAGRDVAGVGHHQPPILGSSPRLQVTWSPGARPVSHHASVARPDRSTTADSSSTAPTSQVRSESSGVHPEAGVRVEPVHHRRRRTSSAKRCGQSVGRVAGAQVGVVDLDLAHAHQRDGVQRERRAVRASARTGPTRSSRERPGASRRTSSGAPAGGPAARRGRRAASSSMSSSRASCEAYIGDRLVLDAPRAGRRARASPLSARWATTWARVQPGSRDGGVQSSSLRAVDGARRAAGRPRPGGRVRGSGP